MRGRGAGGGGGERFLIWTFQMQLMELETIAEEQKWNLTLFHHGQFLNWAKYLSADFVSYFYKIGKQKQ